MINEKNTARQVRIGALLSYLGIGINIVAGLLFTPWIVEQIGKSDYGLYTLSHSLISLFLIDFGLSSATSRFVSKYRAEGDEAKVNDFLGVVYKLYILIDAILLAIFVVIFFFLESIYSNLLPAEIEKLKVVYVISAGFSVVNFPFVTFNGILNAHEKFIQIKIVDILHKVAYVVANTIVLSCGMGLYALVWVNALTGVATVLMKYIVIKTSTPVVANMKCRGKEFYKEIFSFSVWVTVSSLASRLKFNIMPSVLAIMESAAVIAIFGVVQTIEGYSYTITSAINGMFMPKISRIDAKSEGGDVQSLLLSVGRFQFVLNGLIVSGFAIIGKSFIDLWMGEGFSLAYYGVLMIIIPGMFYNCLQIANTTMVVRNKVKTTAIINLIMGAVSILSAVLLVKFIGFLGTCLAIGIAYTFRVVTLNIIYGKALGLNMIDFAKKCYLKMSVPLIVSLLVSWTLCYFIHIPGWLGLVVKAAIITVIYLLSNFVIGFSKKEKAKILSRAGKLIKKK